MPKVRVRDYQFEVESLRKQDPHNILDVKLDDLALMHFILRKELFFLGVDIEDTSRYTFIELGAAQTSQYGKPSFFSRMRDGVKNEIKKFMRQRNADDRPLMDAHGHISHFYASRGDTQGPKYLAYDPAVAPINIDEEISIDNIFGPSIMHYPVSRKELRKRLKTQMFRNFSDIKAYAYRILYEQNTLPVIFSHHVLPIQFLEHGAGGMMWDRDKRYFTNKIPDMPVDLKGLVGLHYHFMHHQKLSEFITYFNERSTITLPNANTIRNPEPFREALKKIYSLNDDLTCYQLKKPYNPSLAFTWTTGLQNYRK